LVKNTRAQCAVFISSACGVSCSDTQANKPAVAIQEKCYVGCRP